MSDSAGPPGERTAIATDFAGFPHVVFARQVGSDRRLMYARRFGGGSWYFETITYLPFPGPVDPSLALAATSFTPESYPDVVAYSPIMGSLVYYTRSGGPFWVAELVDTTGDVGRYSSLAVLPLFSGPNPPRALYASYYRGDTGDLMFAERFGPPVWQRQVVDTAGNVGTHTSIAVEDFEHVHVSYRDEGAGDLKYATRAISTWTIEVVDASANDVGYFSSLAIDAAGNPHIAYFDSTAKALKYAVRSGGVWSVSTVDTGGVGQYASIDLSAQGNARIAYFDAALGLLTYARRVGSSWSFTTVGGPGSPTGVLGALALDVYCRPHVVFLDVGTPWKAMYAVNPPDTATFQAVRNGGIDLASVAVETGNLVVGNIGSSGDDGVSMSDEAASAYSAGWLPLGTAGTYADGAFLQINALYPGDPGTPGALAVPADPVRVTDVGSLLEITADFATAGSATKTVEVYSGGALVARRTGLTGPALARIPDWPVAARADLAPSGGADPPSPRHAVSLPGVASVLIVDNSFAGMDTTVLGDEVRIVAESPTLAVSYLAGLDLRAAQIPTIVVTGESLAAATGVPALPEGAVAARVEVVAVPNPALAGRTAILFRASGGPAGSAAEGASLALYDVSGRRVRTFLSGGLPATRIPVSWDGTDDRGRAVAPGVYVLRFETPRGSATSRVTLVR